MYYMKDFNLLKKMWKNVFSMPLHQTDVNGFKLDLYLLPYGPLAQNGNQLHMRSFIGMYSATLIPPGMQAGSIPFLELRDIYPSPNF